MALSTAVVPNRLGIVPMMMTQHRNFTNPSYCTKTKLMLHSTATPGAPCKNFFNAWNNSSASCSVEFIVDDKDIVQLLPIGANGKKCIKTWHCGTGKTGKSCNATHIATEMCEPTEAQLIPIEYASQYKGNKYPRAYTIRRIQMELKALGLYNGDISGKYDDATEAAVKKFQTSKKLKADGICGSGTAAKMRERIGSYMRYDVEAATPFFNKCYNNAVKLFAFLCGYVGAKPKEIICHCEGWKQGCASNHSDVDHWFTMHNKTMDDFRSDVQKWINGTYIELGESVLSDFDKEYLAAIETTVDAGIINSPDYWKNLLKPDAVLNNNNVMALLRQTGSYFCMHSHVYAADVLQYVGIFPTARVYNLFRSPDYVFTKVDVVNLIQWIAEAITQLRDSTNGTITEPLSYVQALNVLAEYHGILRNPEYWIKMPESSDPLNQNNARALIRQAGDAFCKDGYDYAISAVKNAIGMNSEQYWRSGSYSITNVKYLFRAIAASI